MSYDAESMARAARVTYRELDHWTTRGYLIPDEQHPGTGHIRRWSQREAEVARVTRRLRDAGFRLHVAASLARDAVYGRSDSGVARVHLGPGIHLTVGDVLQACDASAGDVTNSARLATDGQTGAGPTDRAGQEKRDSEGDA